MLFYRTQEEIETMIEIKEIYLERLNHDLKLVRYEISMNAIEMEINRINKSLEELRNWKN